MMKTYRRCVFITLLSVLGMQAGMAQKKPEKWNLENTINYALENNIQIQKSKINLSQSEVDLKQAKAQLHPNLSASVGQNFTNRPLLVEDGKANTYSGNYNVNASMTIFNGGRLIKNIRQQEMQNEVRQYDILESQKDIEMSILQIYIQILYSQDAVNVFRSTVEVSQYQRDRGEALLKAGSISKVDLAQLEAQLSSDKYQLTNAENALKLSKLQLKQLLELGLDESIEIITPEITDENILRPLPDLGKIYAASLDVMPLMKSSRQNLDISALGTSIARAGYWPKVTLSASAGTSHLSSNYLSFTDQLKNNLNEGIGLNINIPIFTNRENKSAVEKAKLNEISAQLDLQDAEKSLLKEIETVYQDAASGQSQYLAATEQVNALQSSYTLIQKQFDLGMKNTLELLTEKNNLLSAQQNLLQAKYTSIMNVQLLNLYQDLPLDLK